MPQSWQAQRPGQANDLVRHRLAIARLIETNQEQGGVENLFAKRKMANYFRLNFEISEFLKPSHNSFQPACGYPNS